MKDQFQSPMSSECYVLHLLYSMSPLNNLLLNNLGPVFLIPIMYIINHVNTVSHVRIERYGVDLFLLHLFNKLIHFFQLLLICFYFLSDCEHTLLFHKVWTSTKMLSLECFYLFFFGTHRGFYLLINILPCFLNFGVEVIFRIYILILIFNVIFFDREWVLISDCTLVKFFDHFSCSRWQQWELICGFSCTGKAFRSLSKLSSVRHYLRNLSFSNLVEHLISILLPYVCKHGIALGFLKWVNLFLRCRILVFLGVYA